MEAKHYHSEMQKIPFSWIVGPICSLLGGNSKCFLNFLLNSSLLSIMSLCQLCSPSLLTLHWDLYIHTWNFGCLLALCALLLQTTPCLWAQNVVKEGLNVVLSALVEATGKVGCRWRVMPGKVFHISWRDVWEPCSWCHVLSFYWCCPSRSPSPTRSAEQVGQSRREFPLSHMEESCLTAQSYWSLILKVKQPASGNWAHKFALCLWKSLSQCFPFLLLLKM